MLNWKAVCSKPVPKNRSSGRTSLRAKPHGQVVFGQQCWHHFPRFPANPTFITSNTQYIGIYEFLVILHTISSKKTCSFMTYYGIWFNQAGSNDPSLITSFIYAKICRIIPCAFFRMPLTKLYLHIIRVQSENMGLGSGYDIFPNQRMYTTAAVGARGLRRGSR